MMMAIARKPSRIAYSVVVWPSSRSRSSVTAICSRNERSHQEFVHEGGSSSVKEASAAAPV